MRRCLVVVLLLVAGCAAPKSSPGHSGPTDPSPTVGEAAAPPRLPELTLPGLGASPAVRLSDVGGTPTVINAWASWCGPCRKELPFLGRAARAYAGRVSFLGIDVADNPDAAGAMVRATGASYPHVVDVKSRTRIPLGYGGGLPTTVFIDAQGRIVGEERTWFRSYADVTAAIRHHLGVAP